MLIVWLVCSGATRCVEINYLVGVFRCDKVC